jgi:Ribonuclease G/E
MKGLVLALDHIGGREAAALLRNGRLDDLMIAPADPPPAPGTIFRGIADRPMKGQGAILLRLPGGSAYLREAAGLKPGQPALVQVTGYAEPGKALPVTAKLLYKGRYAIVTPEAPGQNVSRRLTDPARRAALLALAEAAMGASPMGLILRSEAETGADAEIAAEIAGLLDLATRTMADPGREPALLVPGPGPHATARRDWAAADLTDAEPGSFARHGIADLLDGLRRAEVTLGNGATASIEPTRALVAVDVNTGADGSPAAGLKANLALARELPRQLRLRGLGGQITLDLAPMPKRERLVFEGHLKAAFRADPIETALAGWTPLGHYELQRKRERLPLTPDFLP